MSTEYVIETDALRKAFGDIVAVNGISFRVRKGEFFGILGPNGAGKTTTFYMIVGLVPASKGAVQLDGAEITGLPMYRRARLGLGYLPQESSVFRQLTVWENIQAIVETLPVPRAEQEPLIRAHLQELHLLELAKQKAFTLSGGERRRLEITRALVVKPRFLLLDEPFSGVDPISVREVQDIVVGLKSKGIGVLITDHNVRETLRIVDRAYLIHEGRVLCEGPREALIKDPSARRFYLGEDFQL